MLSPLSVLMCCPSISTSLCSDLEVYDKPSHSNRKNFTSASSTSSSSSISSTSSVLASATLVPFEKSRKHNGWNTTHHHLTPSPSPNVIKTASYSPAGYKKSPYNFTGKVTASPYST